MRFVNKWAFACANYLTSQLGDNHEKRNIYYYAFQIIIGAIVKFALLTLVSLILGTFAPTFFAMLFFVSLRVIAGGYHMKTYDKCVYVSLASFVLAGIAVHNLTPFMTQTPLSIITALSYLISLYVVIRWAPCDNPNRPITRPEEIKKFRILSLLHIHLWLVLMIILIIGKHYMHVLSGSAGILLATFVVAPAGHRFFDRLSVLLDDSK